MATDRTLILQLIDLFQHHLEAPVEPEPEPGGEPIVSRSVARIESVSSAEDLPEKGEVTTVYLVPLVGLATWDPEQFGYRNLITGQILGAEPEPEPEPTPEPTPEPEPEPEPAPKQRVVAIYNGTADGADDAFYSALGDALGAGVSYYTPNAKVKGQYAIRSWDLKRIERGYLPVIHLQSVAHNSAAGGNVQYYPWKHVAEGKYDADFISMANALKDAPAGTAFSFDGEPEVRLEAGSHQPVPNPNAKKTWPAGWPQDGDGLNTPEYYAAAQRRIYEVMHPIAPDVDYRFWFAGHQRNEAMERFYPGDAYVDSIGIDPYVWKHNAASTTPLQKYKPIVDWVRSRSWGKGKPIGISETGIDTSHGEAAGAAFWNNMPHAIETLDLAWVALFNRSQWRITASANPAAWAAYVAAMRKIAGK